jgi:hypothetical protein
MLMAVRQVWPTRNAPAAVQYARICHHIHRQDRQAWLVFAVLDMSLDDLLRRRFEYAMCWCNASDGNPY